MTMIVIEQNATLRRNNPRQVRSKDGAVSTERNPSRDMIRLDQERLKASIQVDTDDVLGFC